MKTSCIALGWPRLERLVILVDVQVFAQGSVNASQAYASLIHSSIERILAVCNEHNTGHKRGMSWSYKLFDSSLSPSASSSTLQKLLKDRSGGQKQIGRFKSAEENLVLFQQTLCTVATEVNSKCDPAQPTRSKADFVVKALQELLSDFNWNSVFISDGSSSDEDQARRRGECQGGRPFSSLQNLVIVFSHLPDNMEQFASFTNMPTPARDTELFKAFSSKMKRLQEPFRLQGISACWIDMPHVATSLTSHARRPPAFTETYRKPQRPELQAVFAQMKWKYTTMDALAVASDCIPPPMLWFSVVHPDLQVQPNAHRMQCRLRISVQGRDGAQLQPEVCKLEAVSLCSNVVDSALMKESVAAMLKSGSLSSKAERLPLENCPSLQTPIVKIVVKSLILKQDVSFKCSLRYLLYHRVERGADSKKRNSIALAEHKESKLGSLADDVASDVYGYDILQQLHQEPMSFEPGDRAWEVLLLAIARKNSVAEVDLYIDGNCSSAIIEPITLQYAALLQKHQSSLPLSPDCNKQLRVQQNGPKILLASSLLQPVLKSGEVARLEGSECARSKQETRPRKRPASPMSVIDGPLLKRVKTEHGSKLKPTCAEEIMHTKREAYSWIQHWRYILHRRTVGAGRVQIENRYMRPGSGQKPSKAISIIKCWLDLVSKPKPLTSLQIVPFFPAVPGPSEPDAGVLMSEGLFSRLGSAERVGQADNSVVPLKVRGLFSAILDTEEQAESYMSSIEQMLQDCCQSDAGDLQVFVKGIICNATRAQRILLKWKQALDLVHPSESMQCPINGDSTEVHSSAQKNIERRETAKPCNSDSSCASNRKQRKFITRKQLQLKAEEVHNKNELPLATKQETLGSVSEVGDCAVPDGNSIEYGGSSDGADSGGQTKEAILSAMVAGQLMDKLLVKPKKLARRYSNCESATSDFVHIRQEKLRAYELQILFRMELIEQDFGGPLEKERTKILKEICKLLDDIQFDLGGGVFGGESLHDYSIRVIHNSYKERLPQTVAEIFERMEFNGYVEGVSELQPAPNSTHVDLVRSHVRKDSEREELTEKLTTMEAVAGSFVPVVQPVEEIGDNGAIPTIKKDPSKTRRKRSVPIDAFTRASEKRKLASRLAHFGGPDSLHRLKKVKIHHQSPKPSKVSSPAMEKSQRKESSIVLETPRFERQNMRVESPTTVHKDSEVESICTRVLPPAFGFGTPARVSKHMLTTRKRRQALFKEKKPPGRGLPRISLDVMKAMAEDQILHRPSKPDCQLDVECLAHNDCAGESSFMYVSQSSEEQKLPDPIGRKESSADILRNTRTTTFDSTELTERNFRVDQGMPENNAENGRRTGLEILGSEGQEHPLIPDAQLETQIIQEDDVTTQVDVPHDFNNGTLINADMPVPSRKNRRKSKHASRSRKLGRSGECSKPRTSAPASLIIPPVAAERDLLGLGFAVSVPVQTLEQSDMVENSQPVDLTSLENRWSDEEIPCTLPTEVPMSVSGYENAQHTLLDTESMEMAGISEPEGGLSRFEELAFRSSPKASLTNCPELGSKTEVLFETQTVEEIHSQKHTNRSPGRAVSEDALSLSTLDFPITWEMPCMDLNETQDFEQEDRVRVSQMMSPTDKSANSGSHSLQPLRINQTSKVCRVDPPSSLWFDRLAAEHDEPLVKNHGLIADDLSVDPDFSQIVKELFRTTQTMEDSQGLKLDDAVEYLDEYSQLLAENWSPQPRLKPEARLSAILEEDAVAVGIGGSPIKFPSPSQNRKCRRPSEGSPGQYISTPNAAVYCKRRPRSNSASPNPTKSKMLRFV